MKTTVLACSIRKFFVVLLAGIIALNATAQTGPMPPELIFMNPVLVSGNANHEGAIYRFANVATGVDAELTLKKFSRYDIVMQDVDISYLGWDKALQPKFGLPGTVPANQDWYIDFEVRFYKAGTNLKQQLQQFDLTALDVDGDGQSLSEYVQMNNPSSVSYSTISALTGATSIGSLGTCPLDNICSTVITCPVCHGAGTSLQLQCDNCEGSGKVFEDCGHPCDGVQEASGPVQNFLNIDTSATQVMATYHYVNKDRITFRIGAKSGSIGTSNDAGIRLNSLWYREFNLAPVAILPVQLTGFTAVRNEGNVLLSWTTASERNFDHFTIQRSTDGKEYKNTALMFSNESLNTVRNYQYNDDLSGVNAPVIYYRLQMVDRSGEITYSPVRLIRIAETTNAGQLVVAPNPVADQLHVTLPTAWQGKVVVLEVYSLNGVRMQQIKVSQASQTEELQLGNLPRGAYLVMASSNGQSIQQRVIRQ